MSSQDNELWKQYWREQRTDLHQHGVNPLLIHWWPSLHLAKGSRVLVPLCGKSQDMLWLLRKGYRVIGVELSGIAIRAFFDENDLGATKRHQGQLTRWGHGNLTILGGDVFSVTATDLGPIDAVYDHAALTALPPDIRQIYVAHIGMIAPDARQLLVLTLEDADQDDSPEQIQGIAQEILALYAGQFEIELAHIQSLPHSDPDSTGDPSITLYRKVYRLTAHDQPPGI